MDASKCLLCHKTFIPSPGTKQIYCSKTCRSSDRNKKRNKAKRKTREEMQELQDRGDVLKAEVDQAFEGNVVPKPSVVLKESTAASNWFSFCEMCEALRISSQGNQHQNERDMRNIAVAKEVRQIKDRPNNVDIVAMSEQTLDMFVFFSVVEKKHKRRYLVENLAPPLNGFLMKKHCTRLPSDFKTRIRSVCDEFLSKHVMSIDQYEVDRKDPVMEFDLRLLVKELELQISVTEAPSKRLDLARTGAMITIGMKTGARISSLCSILWKDLELIEEGPEGNFAVTFYLHMLKGEQGRVNHPVTAVCHVDDTSKPLYWLNLLSQEMWTETIFSKTGKAERTKSSETVLLHSTHKMRKFFQSIVSAVGFPDGMLSPHSLRSGFLCQAIVSAFLSNNTAVDVLLITGIAANWVPNSEKQRLYIRTALKRVLNCSALHVVAIQDNTFVQSKSAAVESANKDKVTGLDILRHFGFSAQSSQMSHDLIVTSRLNPESFHNLEPGTLKAFEEEIE